MGSDTPSEFLLSPYRLFLTWALYLLLTTGVCGSVLDWVPFYLCVQLKACVEIKLKFVANKWAKELQSAWSQNKRCRYKLICGRSRYSISAWVGFNPHNDWFSCTTLPFGVDLLSFNSSHVLELTDMLHHNCIRHCVLKYNLDIINSIQGM